MKTENARCPSCDSKKSRAFYSVAHVPVHSCLMFSSRREALDFPRGDIELGFCESCGFVWNTAFDPEVRDYSPLYEDQQSCSPTFNAFAKRLAGSLIDKYNIRGKNVLEIGCGKGDFLELICEMGNNRGIGVDPSCEKDRIQGPARNRITIVADYYSEKYAHLGGDIVLCRHTLEHIPDTHAFVQTVREAVGDRMDTIVCFEIPDVSIVLSNIVFWDIYYEHCSYFSPGSLARLFRRCRFDVLDVYHDYGDQYLLIDAKPAAERSRTQHPLEESLDEAADRVDRFRSTVTQEHDRWKRAVEAMGRDGKAPVIWGSGSKCVAFLTTLGIADEIGCVVDINPRRHGKYLAGVGRQIRAPEYLKEYRPDRIIVMNPIYEREIREMVGAMGLSPAITTV